MTILFWCSTTVIALIVGIFSAIILRNNAKAKERFREILDLRREVRCLQKEYFELTEYESEKVDELHQAQLVIDDLRWQLDAAGSNLEMVIGMLPPEIFSPKALSLVEEEDQA